MERQILIRKTSDGTQIAILEDRRLKEVFVERNVDHQKGDIYKGRVQRVVPGINAAFIEMGHTKPGFLYGGDVEGVQGKGADSKQNPPLTTLLKAQQDVLVQILKDPLGAKGHRVTMDLAIPGRFLVLTPNNRSLSISRKITDEGEIQRLRGIVIPILPDDLGIIIRTAAARADQQALEKDLNDVILAWHDVQANVASKPAPARVFRNLDLSRKTLRDLVSPETTAIITDDAALCEELRVFLSEVIPEAVDRLRLQSQNLFRDFKVDGAIQDALQTRVAIPGGGHVIFEETEALTACDVNTGKYVGKSDFENTILQMNLAAVPVIAEQLRLRNIGGIVVIDFIDMNDRKSRRMVYDAMVDALKLDRAKTHALPISELGLLQMTRQRSSESLRQLFAGKCKACDGTGVIVPTRIP